MVPGVVRRIVLAALLLTALILTEDLVTVGAAARSTPEEVLTAFAAGFNEQDAARAAAAFGTDGELMLPEAPPAKGRAGIASTLDEQFRVTRVIDLLSVTVTRSGRQAVASGRLTMSTRTPVHGADVRAGSYLAALRQVAGGWEITHLMFTLPLRPDFVG
jgi:ketosteroid isomerase-like protein